jgi:nicotinate phosphoribosyltransferase
MRIADFQFAKYASTEGGVRNRPMLQRAYPLSTDLYQFAMAAALFDNHLHHERATFEMFVRSLPKSRSYLIVAGLEQVLDYLHTLQFTGDQIDTLRHHPAFKNASHEFFDYLSGFKFTGDVWAIPEGTAAFANEPMLRISAPIVEAQIVETYILATMNFQTMIASKAARIVTAAQGRSVIEFGTRRAHGSEAGLAAARAAYISGCTGTSNVEAGFLFGIPIFGTLAHSFIMSFDEEDEAFRAFLKVFPENATILVDTYDTLEAVQRLAAFKEKVSAIRLDSGDLLTLSQQAREILDSAGKTDVKILASGDLNESIIKELIERGAKIDAFGVGTQLATSYDRPALGGIYKLVSVSDRGKLKMKMKLSPEKVTYPGVKQVWRRLDESGKYAGDLIALEDEKDIDKQGGWRPLLQQVMKSGIANEQRAIHEDWLEPDELHAVRNIGLQRLIRARNLAAEELQRLPDELLALETEATYPLQFSARIINEKERLQKEIESQKK